MEESTVGTLSSLWIFTYTRDKLNFLDPYRHWRTVAHSQLAKLKMLSPTESHCYFLSLCTSCACAVSGGALHWSYKRDVTGLFPIRTSDFLEIDLHVRKVWYHARQYSHDTCDPSCTNVFSHLFSFEKCIMKTTLTTHLKKKNR